jgi:hypothetical protein
MHPQTHPTQQAVPQMLSPRKFPPSSITDFLPSLPLPPWQAINQPLTANVYIPTYTYSFYTQWLPSYDHSLESLLPSLDLLLLLLWHLGHSLSLLFERLEVDHLNCWVLELRLERFLPSKLSRVDRGRGGSVRTGVKERGGELNVPASEGEGRNNWTINTLARVDEVHDRILILTK